MGRGAAHPPNTQYSHTTLSNLKLSPPVESCRRSIYSTGTAGRGLWSRSSSRGAPAVCEAPAPCPARSSRCPAMPVLRYPTTPTQTSILRGLGQSYRRCRGVRMSASTATCCSGTTLGTHGRCTEGLRSRAEAPREHAAQSGSSHYKNPGFQRQIKPFPAIQQRVTLVWDRCLQQMSVPTDLRRVQFHILQRPGWIFSE